MQRVIHGLIDGAFTISIYPNNLNSPYTQLHTKRVKQSATEKLMGLLKV